MIQITQIFEIFKKFYQTPTGKQIVIMTAAKVIPAVIKEIDSWISTSSYELAKDKVKEIENYDFEKIQEIYDARSNDMSPVVKKAFKESLRKRGHNE